MKCIIVEGPQGCGKTNLTNYLRDNIAASNLYRLTGNKDKTITGKEKSTKMYYALLNYIKEQVYAKLGYKDYDFTDVYEDLLKIFGELDFEIYYISLYLKDTSIFETRLKRDHHQYQAFSLENSTNQQNAYKSLLPSIKALKNTKVYKVAMDDFDAAYKEIDNILGINKENNK